MCDYSLESSKTRRAKDEDKLVTKRSTLGTVGFVAVDDPDCYVCLKEGDELELSWPDVAETERVKFAQRDLELQFRHHDGVLRAGGQFMLFADLPKRTLATVIRALPEAIADAAKGNVAFEPEVRIEAPVVAALVPTLF